MTETRGVVERMLRCKSSKAKQIPCAEEVLAKSLYSRHLALLASLGETRTPVPAYVITECIVLRLSGCLAYLI